MLGDDGQLLLGVGEGRFDNQVFKIADTIDRLPQRIACGGIAAEHQAGLAAVNLETDSRYHMVGRQWRDLAPAYLHGFAAYDALEAQQRLVQGRYLGEIRPDLPVENVLLEYGDRLVGGMDDQRLVAHEPDAVDQQRQAGDVIEMRVRHEDMVDHAHLGQAEIADARPCVDQHIVIEQHRGRAQIPPDPAAASQYSQFHR